MSRPSPPPSAAEGSGVAALPAGTLERLHEPLLALHAAVEVEPLWRATVRVLRTALPLHRVTLFLGHIGMGEARVVLTDPPIADPARWYAARGQHNPFSPFIAAHPGIRCYRFEDVLPPPARFRRTVFYRQFAVPEGWDKGVSVLFWQRREVKAMFSVYRGPADPAFTPEEVGILRYLQPFVGTAIDRVRLLHSERLARRGLEEFNKRLPVGLLTLDWNLRAVFANPEGLNACALWNLGPAARTFNSRDCFAVPPAVAAAARGLREAIAARNPKELRARVGDLAQVAHPGHAGLVATISASHNPASALARPRFLVVFEARATGPAANARPSAALVRLRELTPREREIALLVVEGHPNAEIARRLSKSVLTIKTQLNSVFRKLGLRRRTQLITLLR